MKAPVLCRARRPFVICPPILLRVAVLFTAFLWLTAQATSPNRQPNIVVILAVDLGWGDLGIYGHPKFRTPNLDRMAREGARLTHFYSPTPYCAPSRASLLTGRYPFRHGITGNPAPDAGIDDIGISASEITLGEAFQASGYQTGIIGKWHLGHKPEFYPMRPGFHEYLGILCSNDMRPVQLIEVDKVVEYPVVQANLTRRYTDRALSFIDRNKNRPFFLYFPHAMPHKPLAASEEFTARVALGCMGTSWRNWIGVLARSSPSSGNPDSMTRRWSFSQVITVRGMAEVQAA
jgi:arylsulfatase A-like enzyme